MPKSTRAGRVRVPSAAAQPMTGGRAPGMAPTSVDSDVRRLSGVYASTYVPRVSVAIPAERRLTNDASSTTPAVASRAANQAPSAEPRRPLATGRPRVRPMRASVSRSQTWLNAAAPPATSAVPMRVWTRVARSTPSGEARYRPASVVISTNTLSRGFVSETKSVARTANRVAVDAHDPADGTGEEDAVAAWAVDFTLVLRLVLVCGTGRRASSRPDSGARRSH